MKTEKPILTSTPMVQAILDGRKAQTRRIIKPQYEVSGSIWTSIKTKTWMYQSKIENCEFLLKVCPYGQVGDILWVRETWLKTMIRDEEGWFYIYIYRADCNEYDDYKGEWKPSIFMPKEASRIKLEITDIRVERVQDISNADIIAEGIKKIDGPVIGYPFGIPFNYNNGIANYTTPREAYMELWESINGKGSWNKNPWVWCISFKRL